MTAVISRRSLKLGVAFAALLSASLLTAGQASAQLAVTQDNDAANLVADLLTLVGNPGTITNQTLTGAADCSGTFTDGLAVDGGIDFAVDTGVVLSTGAATDAVPPNSSDSTTTSFGTAGDPNLNVIVAPFNTTTFDACVLEFDFQCPVGSQGSEVSFRYNFASEEYNEFTNSPFTNVFAWFLNGSNIALLPDGITPVQINTVNGGHPSECINGFDDDGDGPIDGADSDCTIPSDDIVGENNSNSAFFNNNDCQDPDGDPACPDGIEADGYTDTLTAAAATIPGVNHMKLAIADAGDSILDSWAFLEGGSFECVAVIKTDAKPGSNPNCFKDGSGGVVSMAYYGSAEFDVLDIDQTTLMWGGAVPLRCNVEDAFAADGIDDLVCKYKKSDVPDLPVAGDDCKLVEGGGLLLDGTVFKASDYICVAGDPVCDRGDPI